MICASSPSTLRRIERCSIFLRTASTKFLTASLPLPQVDQSHGDKLGYVATDVARLIGAVEVLRDRERFSKGNPKPKKEK